MLFIVYRVLQAAAFGIFIILNKSIFIIYISGANNLRILLENVTISD